MDIFDMTSPHPSLTYYQRSYLNESNSGHWSQGTRCSICYTELLVKYALLLKQAKIIDWCTHLGKYNLFFSRYVFKPLLMCSSRALLSWSFSSNPGAQVAFTTYNDSDDSQVIIMILDSGHELLAKDFICANFYSKIQYSYWPRQSWKKQREFITNL